MEIVLGASSPSPLDLGRQVCAGGVVRAPRAWADPSVPIPKSVLTVLAAASRRVGPRKTRPVLPMARRESHFSHGLIAQLVRAYG